MTGTINIVKALILFSNVNSFHHLFEHVILSQDSRARASTVNAGDGNNENASKSLMILCLDDYRCKR